MEIAEILCIFIEDNAGMFSDEIRVKVIELKNLLGKEYINGPENVCGFRSQHERYNYTSC